MYNIYTKYIHTPIVSVPSIMERAWNMQCLTSHATIVLARGYCLKQPWFVHVGSLFRSAAIKRSERERICWHHPFYYVPCPLNRTLASTQCLSNITTRIHIRVYLKKG